MSLRRASPEDDGRGRRCLRQEDQAPKASVAQRIHNLDLEARLGRPLRGRATVGSNVVRRVEPARRRFAVPMRTAALAIASSTRITGMSKSCCASSTPGPIEEHVTRTASAPAISADSIIASRRRIVTGTQSAFSNGVGDQALIHHVEDGRLRHISCTQGTEQRRQRRAGKESTASGLVPRSLASTPRHARPPAAGSSTSPLLRGARGLVKRRCAATRKRVVAFRLCHK